MQTVDADDLPADPGLLVALALVAPWMALAWVLPAPWMSLAVVGQAILLALLALAARWSHRYASARGLPADRWAAWTVVTFGAAMLVLLARPQGIATGPQYVCMQCGRLGHLHEPFCFGCGSLSA